MSELNINTNNINKEEFDIETTKKGLFNDIYFSSKKYIDDILQNEKTKEKQIHYIKNFLIANKLLGNKFDKILIEQKENFTYCTILDYNKTKIALIKFNDIEINYEIYRKKKYEEDFANILKLLIDITLQDVVQINILQNIICISEDTQKLLLPCVYDKEIDKYFFESITNIFVPETINDAIEIILKTQNLCGIDIIFNFINILYEHCMRFDYDQYYLKEKINLKDKKLIDLFNLYFEQIKNNEEKLIDFSEVLVNIVCIVCNNLDMDKDKIFYNYFIDNILKIFQNIITKQYTNSEIFDKIIETILNNRNYANEDLESFQNLDIFLQSIINLALNNCELNTEIIVKIKKLVMSYDFTSEYISETLFRLAELAYNKCQENVNFKNDDLDEKVADCLMNCSDLEILKSTRSIDILMYFFDKENENILDYFFDLEECFMYNKNFAETINILHQQLPNNTETLKQELEKINNTMYLAVNKENLFFLLKKQILIYYKLKTLDIEYNNIGQYLEHLNYHFMYLIKHNFFNNKLMAINNKNNQKTIYITSLEEDDQYIESDNKHFDIESFIKCINNYYPETKQLFQPVMNYCVLMNIINEQYYNINDFDYNTIDKEFIDRFTIILNKKESANFDIVGIINVFDKMLNNKEHFGYIIESVDNIKNQELKKELLLNIEEKYERQVYKILYTKEIQKNRKLEEKNIYLKRKLNNLQQTSNTNQTNITPQQQLFNLTNAMNLMWQNSCKQKK